MIHKDAHWTAAIVSLLFLVVFALPRSVSAAVLRPATDVVEIPTRTTTAAPSSRDLLAFSPIARRHTENALEVLSDALKTFPPRSTSLSPAVPVVMLAKEIAQHIASEEKGDKHARDVAVEATPTLTMTSEATTFAIVRRQPQNALSILSDALKTFPHPLPTHKPEKSQNALSVLSGTLKTFPHASPTHKPEQANPPPHKEPSPATHEPGPKPKSSLTQISFPPLGQVGKQISSGNDHKSDEIAKNSGAMNGMEGMRGTLANMKCSKFVSCKSFGERTAGVLGPFRFWTQPCSQCATPGDCCTQGPALYGFVSCKGKDVGPC